MLQERFGHLIHDGIVEGRRLALCSDLWRFASSAPSQCDLLLTLAPVSFAPQLAVWLVEQVNCLILTFILLQIKRAEPQLKIEVRYHRLTECYALYLTGEYVR
jgi:hypothetical protein